MDFGLVCRLRPAEVAACSRMCSAKRILGSAPRPSKNAPIGRGMPRWWLPHPSNQRGRHEKAFTHLGLMSHKAILGTGHWEELATNLRAYRRILIPYRGRHSNGLSHPPRASNSGGSHVRCGAGVRRAEHGHNGDSSDHPVSSQGRVSKGFPKEALSR